MIPAAMNMRETVPQMTPQQAELPPYRFAKTEASLSLTFRRIRSSHMSCIPRVSD